MISLISTRQLDWGIFPRVTPATGAHTPTLFPRPPPCDGWTNLIAAHGRVSYRNTSLGLCQHKIINSSHPSTGAHSHSQPPE